MRKQFEGNKTLTLQSSLVASNNTVLVDFGIVRILVLLFACCILLILYTQMVR